MTILKPKCLSSSDSDTVMGIAYCSNGFIVPCCWLDSHSSKNELISIGLYNDELKLENNNNLEDIINSEPWKTFVKILVDDPEKAPKKCHEKCKQT